jgi:hypothetical protein
VSSHQKTHWQPLPTQGTIRLVRITQQDAAKETLLNPAFNTVFTVKRALDRGNFRELSLWRGGKPVNRLTSNPIQQPGPVARAHQLLELEVVKKCNPLARANQLSYPSLFFSMVAVFPSLRLPPNQNCRLTGDISILSRNTIEPTNGLLQLTSLEPRFTGERYVFTQYLGQPFRHFISA